MLLYLQLEWYATCMSELQDKQDWRMAQWLTWTAPLQSLGSEVMVSVETAHPSLLLSLMSSSMLMKGGSASTYRWFTRKLSTLRTIRPYSNMDTSQRTSAGMIAGTDLAGHRLTYSPRCWLSLACLTCCLPILKAVSRALERDR